MREGLQVQGRISIGQGYEGKSVKGIGIGKCCRGAEACVMGCPPTASAILGCGDQWGDDGDCREAMGIDGAVTAPYFCGFCGKDGL